MPPRIRHFLHDSVQTGNQALGTAFNTSDVHTHNMLDGFPDSWKDRNYQGIVEGIHVRLTNASAPSATKITIRICADANGDDVLVPDTEAELVAGVTTTTTQCAAFSVKLPLFQILSAPGNGNLYLFAKVDDATVAPAFAQSSITWRE